jgi:hypothetical protein
MSFELKAKGRSAHWSNSGWPAVLQLAEDYGWQPAGTIPPKRINRDAWDGGYASCDGQLVSADDAKALADALERGLADDFKKATPRTAPASQQPNNEHQQEAFEKLSALANAMSFEVVNDPPSRAPKPKRGKPKMERADGDPLETAMAQQGIRPEDLPALLASLYGSAPAQEPHQEWFTTEDGRKLVRDLVEFCRKGEFRIT